MEEVSQPVHALAESVGSPQQPDDIGQRRHLRPDNAALRHADYDIPRGLNAHQVRRHRAPFLLRLGRVRLLFSDVGHQDGDIVRYAPGKLKRGEKCFTVRTPDNYEDEFSLQEVEDGILAYAAHHNCTLRDGRLRDLRYNDHLAALEPLDGVGEGAAANTFVQYLPYVASTTDGVAVWQRDVPLSPHLQCYEEVCAGSGNSMQPPPRRTLI